MKRFFEAAWVVILVIYLIFKELVIQGWKKITGKI